MDPLVKSILEVNGLDEQSIVEFVCRLARLYDLVPIDYVHWALLPKDKNPFGDFDSLLKPARQALTRYLKDEVLPKVLAADSGLKLDWFQIYFQGRRWRELLWDSKTRGTEFPLEELVDILVSQWRRAAGREDVECVFKRCIEKHLQEISAGGHSESITARGLLFEEGSYQCSASETAKSTFTVIDTSLPPYDGTTAAAKFQRPCDGASAADEFEGNQNRTVVVVVPVARQWNAKKERPEVNERLRLMKYLADLREFFIEHDYDFEIHAPKIGKKGRWLKS